MKKLILSAALMAVSLGSMAQIADDDKQLFNHVGLGMEVGTTGIGFNVATTITPYVQARAGISFMPSVEVKDINVKTNLSGQAQTNYNQYREYLQAGVPMYGDTQAEMQEQWNICAPYTTIPSEVKVKGKLNMTDFKLLFDIYPTKKSAWRLTLGFYAGKSHLIEVENQTCIGELQAVHAYNQSHFRAVKEILGYDELGVQVGDYFITPNANGITQAYLKVKGFKPYVGIGSGRAISNKHRLSFAWDLGCQFWSTPTIFLTRGNGEDAEAPKNGIDGDGGIIKTISKIKVYPTLSFRINGRIL